MSSTQSNNVRSNVNNTIDSSHQDTFIPPIQPIQVNIQIIIINYHNTYH